MARSVCTTGRPVAFYWRAAPRDLHVDAAVEALMRAIARSDRVTGNLWIDADNEAMFRQRLAQAQRGLLRPGEDVRSIRNAPSPLDLSEIRWLEVTAIPINPASGMYGTAVDNIQVRLYYVEEGQRWVVGLLAHEKDLTGTEAEIEARQDERIRDAVSLALNGANDRWAVPELDAGCTAS